MPAPEEPQVDGLAHTGWSAAARRGGGKKSAIATAYPRGARNYWKSSFLGELSDGVSETFVSAYARCPSPMSQLLLEHVHGAAARVPGDATAFPHRVDGYNCLILTQGTDPADDLAAQPTLLQSSSLTPR